MLTRKKAKELGPALALGEFKTDSSAPIRKTPCKRRHRWKTGLYNRRCAACGEEEEKNAAGVWESIFQKHNS